jgi:tetratricopeptide (TPR) repeat protein
MYLQNFRLLVLCFATACASRAAGPTVASPATGTAKGPPIRTVELEPMRIDVVQGDRGPTTKAYDARSLLDDGNEALVMHRWDDALAAYDHLLADFPDSRLVVPALFNSGQAYEGKEDWGRAAERYHKLVDTASDTPDNKEDRKNAYFRIAAVLAEAGQFAESRQALEKLLSFTELAPAERIEALARLGFAFVQTKDYASGEEVLRRAIAYHREVQGTVTLESSYFVAMAQFYLAEIPHQEFDAIPLRYPEEQMKRDVEQKSQLFLMARDRYVKTVELKDPTWATAAVFQMASMYKEFWDQWMAVPVPSGFNADEAREYIKQVNEEPQLRQMLEKALYFHEKNVAMARDAHVSTGWSQQSDVAAEEIRKLLAQQARGDYVAPGTAPRPAGALPNPDRSSPTPAVYVPARVDL